MTCNALFKNSFEMVERFRFLKIWDLGIGFQKCPMLCNALFKNSFEVVERFRFLKIGRPWKFAFKNMLCSVMLYVFED